MEKRRLLILLALALAARAGAFLLAARGGILIGEGRVYSNLAENLLEGRGYVLSAEMLSPPEPARGAASVIQERTFEFYRRVDGFYGVLRPERPTLFIPPGYPVLMAAGYAILGAGNLLAIRGLQLLAGLVTVILGFALARRHLRNPEAWLVCLFIALDPFEIYFEAVPATQAAFGLFTTAALVLSTRALDGGRALQAALASSVWGLAYLIRPAAMPMMCVFLLCILLVRGRPVSARLAAIGTGILSFVIVLSPWILHAHSVSGQWRITPTQGGVNLWESNGRIFSSHFEGEIQGAVSLYGPLRDELEGSLRKPWLAEFPEFRDEPEWVRDSVLYRRTTEFLAANPSLMPRLTLLRFAEFFKPFPFNDFPLHYMLAGLATFGLVLVFAGAGLVRFLRSRDPSAVMIALSVALYSLAHLSAISGTPHRVGIDIPLAVLAGSGLSAFASRSGLWRRLERFRPRR